jgi:hypothetical protein
MTRAEKTMTGADTTMTPAETPLPFPLRFRPSHGSRINVSAAPTPFFPSRG